MSDFICPEGAHLIKLGGKSANGRFAIVDADIYQPLCGFKWYLTPKNYVCAADTRKADVATTSVPALRLHRFVMGAIPGQIVDHINRNPLDNRRCNLRFCSPGENTRNSKKSKRGVTSQFKGVSIAVEKYFASRITFERKTIFLGFFSDELEAAKAYDEAARYLFGDFAATNFEGETATDPAELIQRNKPHRSSSFTGVSYFKRTGRWAARAPGGIYLGFHTTELEAARVRDEFVKLHQIATRLNFPDAI